MTDPITHLQIDRELCGVVLELTEGHASVELTTTQAMAADDRGLVHGGFVFGAADYAAMLAVNHPNVVLGAANVSFLAPVRVGERVHLAARVRGDKKRKYDVGVSGHVGATRVFDGTFTCYVLDQHVFDKKK